MNCKQKKERFCAVCGSKIKKFLFHQVFAGAPEGSLLDGYDVVICSNCGFAYADSLPEQSEFDAYYENMSKYEYDYKGGESDFDAKRFPVGADFIKSLVSNANARILDVGCSNGGFLHALKKIGFLNVLGVDPSPQCAQNASRLYGIRVAKGTLSKLPKELGQFDLVILGAVLEHVRDLKAALYQTRSLLKPQGLLYVEVPDITQFNYSPDAPFQEFSVEHINYFSVISLENLLATAGFEMIQWKQTSTMRRENVVSPELKAMFRMIEISSTSQFTYDAETECHLLEYICSSRAVERRIHAAIDPWVRSGSAIIVWGVGTHTQRLLATSALPKANILAFVDSNPRYQGKQMNGVPILSPVDLLERQEPILISSRFFQQEIEQQIRETLGLTNELILLYQH